MLKEGYRSVGAMARGQCPRGQEFVCCGGEGGVSGVTCRICSAASFVTVQTCPQPSQR